MHPDVQALLAVQVDDLETYKLEDRLSALEPRLAALEKERSKTSSQVERLKGEIAHEEHRHREALTRLETHKALVERSQRAYESVTTPREANAASAQLEQTKRMVADCERDAQQVASVVGDLRHRLVETEHALLAVEEQQSTARSELGAERAAIEAEIATVRTRREAATHAVPRAMLTQYDKVRVRKREASLVPLRGPSCSACDTAIPTQRRATLAASGKVLMCEGCGALLYAAD